MRSAPSTVDSRCAITNVVRPRMSRSSASCTSASTLAVQRARGLVEDQHARVLEQRAGDRDALPLAAGERHAALADQRVVAVGERRG
jgi:hypothetical protein